ncbi:MAG: 50S ribosome-binding GTPase [Candidatus Woesebacteria bacterium]|nr:50S ribosome-binding GTPase [Candidatus Woesebacteria bacterium]
MTDFTQTIEEIKKELRETPHHKGTEHYIGRLRARLARIEDKIYEASSKGGGGGGGGYAVKKTGDASVVLIGPPSAGKSTLLNKFTNAQSKVAAYAFTTTTVIPGMMLYKDAYIQIFDIPGLLEGASKGKGRGKEVLSVARNSDLLLVISDVQRINYIEKMTQELEGAGIRINKIKPNVLINKKIIGGITIHTNIKQDLDDLTIKEIASEMGIKNADISIKEKVTIDSLIDSFSTSRVYIPAIFVVNKTDTVHRPQFTDHYLAISAEKGTGLENLKEEIWNKLRLLSVYLVQPNEEPNFESPIIMREGDLLSDVTVKLGTDFSEKRLAKIWGNAAHFPGQEVPTTIKVTDRMQVRFL